MRASSSPTRSSTRSSPSASTSRMPPRGSSSTAIRARWSRPTRVEEMLAAKGPGLDAVIEIKVDDDILVDRSPAVHLRQCGAGYHDSNQAEGRGRLRQLRLDRIQAPPDDNPETLRTTAAGLLQGNLAADRLLLCQGQAEDSVDGMADIDTVTEQIEAMLESGPKEK